MGVGPGPAPAALTAAVTSPLPTADGCRDAAADQSP